ncbi:OmpA family protein [Novosphingobium acidiphilum]|uniref:OmpA family protein n=1 Tax=Novosphingobium acidiphilum TaxID=505248 RepID=UPI000409B0EF|nr:OmpA family protein [Novosphingobium acidiphilum]
MRVISNRPTALAVLAVLAVPAWGSASAQGQMQTDPNIVVNGERAPDAPALVPGPEIRGVIAARNGNRIKVMTPDGAGTVIAISDSTRIKGGGGLFGTSSSKYSPDQLLNGLPVTVRTLQADGGLVAAQVTFKTSDLKTANMIRTGTSQRFDEQAAATEALRGRMGDIDKYNIKSTTNVFFDTGKAALSGKAREDLCAAAAAAENTNNALMLVVGYTDSVGSDEYNQTLSEKRAGSVINFLQQACHWKPYRMLTPTGMAKADPLASNDTPEGKAQNRRVSVNILVSKGLDGL